MLKNLTRSSVVLSASVAAVALATTAAAVLPEAASDTAREHTADVTIPGPNAAVGDHATGQPETLTEDVTDQTVEGANDDTHGAEVSDLATSTTLTGAEKGAAIAELASDGRSAARGQSDSQSARGTDGQAKAAEASATGQEKSAAHRP